MKTQCSAALATFLDTLCQGSNDSTYALIDLYTITLLNGITLRLAAWPVPITFPSTGIYAPGSSVGGNTRAAGHTYLAAGPYVSRSRLVQAIKLEVSQIKVTIQANPTMTIGSTPVLAAIREGLFAGAFVWVDRLWASTVMPLDLTLGTVNWFTGRMAEIEKLGRAEAVISCKDPTSFFASAYPRNSYRTGCDHIFGDPGCTIDKTTLQQSGAVQSGSTASVIKTNLTQANPPAAPSTPGLSASGHQANVNLAAATYYVVVTYTGPTGESLPSGEASLAVTGSGSSGANGTTDKLLIVAHPSSAAGATGWNVYVGLAAGQEQLQASFVGFSANWIQLGVLAQGAPPPNITAGYFAGGLFTFNSGVNAGLSATITSYDLVAGNGVVTVSPPFIADPAPGDTITVVPDCPKTVAACRAYGNIQNFRGFPFLPAPEQSI